MKSKLSLVASLLLCALSSRADIYTGLVSYWPMEVKNGSTTPDVSFGNDLTTPGNPTVAAGQVGNAITMVGANDYLTISHGADPTINGLPIYNTKSYTIAMWVKGAASTSKAIFTEASSLATTPFIILQTGGTTASNGKFDIIIRNDGGAGTPINHAQSTATVFNNAWHHIAWVDDNGTCRLYVDGVVDIQTNYVNSGSYTFNNTTIGALIRTTISMQYTGASFDEVAIWERALTPSEVAQVKTSGLTAPVAARAPAFTSQPASVTKNQGDWVLYTANVVNNRPFTYQWSKNGSAISGATDRTYRVTGLQTNNSGDYYSVAVSNGTGSTNSTNAVITVVPDSAPALTNGILAYWPLDQVTNNPTMGTTNSPELYSSFDMVSGGGFDAPNLVAGEFGNAAGLDGITQYLRRTNGLPVYNNLNYSISMWVKGDFTSQSDHRAYAEGNSTNNNTVFSLGTDNTAAGPSLTATIRTDGNSFLMAQRKSTRPVFDNNWHHLVWTDANGKAKLYVDGTLDETDYTYNRSGAVLPDRTCLGAFLRSAPLTGSFYYGAIDEVATWNRALSWSEVQLLTNSTPPVPVAIIPPSIVSQPASQTNGVFTGDNVTFTVQAIGTAPLSYLWLKNGTPITGNSTSTNNSLSLLNVQPSDNGAFSVVITNVGGSITSQVAQLIVTPYTAATNGVVLNVDIGSVLGPDVQTGFSEFTLATNPTNFGGVGLSISAISNTLADRLRPTPVNNPPAFNQGAIFRDFIFASSAANNTGIRIQLSRLAPNTKYAVTLWSFDSGSLNPRYSDWTETASGTPVTVQTAYVFNGSLAPTNDFEQTLGGLVMSSPTGTMQLEGRVNPLTGSAGPAVFVNALRLEANPAPTSTVSTPRVVGSNLVFTVTMNYPNQPVTILQSSDVINGPWVPATNGTTYTNGMVISAAFPIPPDAPQMFYRAATQTP
jgi:hypothetical protein